LIFPNVFVGREGSRERIVIVLASPVTSPRRTFFTARLAPWRRRPSVSEVAVSIAIAPPRGTILVATRSVLLVELVHQLSVDVVEFGLDRGFYGL
jgi:hypothetical protein